MRFEIRECEGGFVQILQFEQNATKPSQVLETGESWPPHITHVMNTLVLQNIGGVAADVFILTFKDGKASKPIRNSTTGYFRVERDSNGTALIVIVPPVHTMNGVLTREKKYSFLIE